MLSLLYIIAAIFLAIFIPWLIWDIRKQIIKNNELLETLIKLKKDD